MRPNPHTNIREAYYQQLRTQKVKIHTRFNPYLTQHIENQVSIQVIEDVEVYHRRVGLRYIGELFKDRRVKKRHKRRVMKDLLKFWDKQFKEEVEAMKKIQLDRIKRLKKRKVKRIKGSFILFFIMVTLLSFMITRQYAPLTAIPVIGQQFKKLYELLEHRTLYYSFFTLSYFSLFTALYLMIVQTYFNLFQSVGGKAEQLVLKVFMKVQVKYKRQHKLLRRHFKKLIKSRLYTKTYPIQQFFDPQEMLMKVADYGEQLDERIGTFNKNYLRLRLGGGILQLFVMMFLIYIGWQYVQFVS